MLISIIIPVYNAEKTISNAILSVANQLTKDIELIVVDGNSTDNTLNIINKYRNIIDKVISEPDKGYSDALNKGIKAANGDYIMMLAADDILLPKAINSFKSTLKEDTEVWCGSIIQKLPYGYRLRKSKPELEKLYFECSLENPASFYRKTLFERFGLFDLSYKCAADREMFLRLYTHNVKFQIEQIPTVLFEMGGLSTQDPEKYGLPEDEKISINYGLSIEKAQLMTSVHRKLLLKEKKILNLKIFLSKLRLLQPLYYLFGKKDSCLSKKELSRYGVTYK